MNEGKKFEKDFENSIPQYTWYYRIKDSSSSWSNSNNSRFTQKSPCDYIIFKGGKLYLLELKSHKGKSLPLATIREQQLLYLSNLNFTDVIGYFIINFRDIEETYAVEGYKIKNIDRKSISLEFLKQNGVKISQTIKRTRYTYDLSNIWR